MVMVMTVILHIYIVQAMKKVMLVAIKIPLILSITFDNNNMYSNNDNKDNKNTI